MTHYRIVLLGAAGRVLSAGQAFYADEARMRTEASRLLASRADCICIEIWEGPSLLLRLGRPPSAAYA